MRWRDAHERRLIQLLCGTADARRAALDEISALVHGVDFTNLVALLKRLNMLVLIGSRLRSMGFADMPELERELTAYAARAHAWGTITEFTALDVLDRLALAGVRALPLKGSILARQLHHDVAARTSIDIDILVAPGDLTEAIAAVEELGWRAQRDIPRVGGLPLLHETLIHPTLPRIELHWRIHWYEGRFAADALARAGQPGSGLPLEMQPLDGLVALMLFYARDGFAGLRFPADVATWWDLRFAGAAAPSPADFVTQRYPALAAPVSAASTVLSDLVGVPMDQAPALPFRWRVAVGLASPFLDGGRQQTEANAGLTDLLLAPPSGAGDAIRRVLQNAPAHSVRAATTRTADWRASPGHVLRVAGRWSRAFVPAVLRGYAPVSPAGSIAARPGARPTGRRPRRST